MIQVVNMNTVRDLVPNRDRPSEITIYQSGRIRLSSGLADDMGAAHGDRVTFFRIDGRHYLAKESAEKRTGFRLSGGEAPTLHSSCLVQWLIEELDLPLGKVNRVKLPVASAPQYINGFHVYQINPGQ